MFEQLLCHTQELFKHHTQELFKLGTIPTSLLIVPGPGMCAVITSNTTQCTPGTHACCRRRCTCAPRRATPKCSRRTSLQVQPRPLRRGGPAPMSSREVKYVRGQRVNCEKESHEIHVTALLVLPLTCVEPWSRLPPWPSSQSASPGSGSSHLGTSACAISHCIASSMLC